MKQNVRPVAFNELKDPIIFLAFGFGSGLLPKAPGTFGTLSAVPIFILMSALGLVSYLALVALLAALGIWFCGYAAKRLGVHDHPGIVWDEIVGFLITMIAGSATPISIIAGFVFFRIFDIFKPWPIGEVDKNVKGGFGVMLDDVLAGLYAGVCLMVFSSVLSFAQGSA